MLFFLLPDYGKGRGEKGGFCLFLIHNWKKAKRSQHVFKKINAFSFHYLNLSFTENSWVWFGFFPISVMDE